MGEVIALVGAQWGDEGKGKIVDLISEQSAVVIRAHGGNNAGHTVQNEHGEFALHLIPSGIFNPNAINIIGSGTAVDPEVLEKEIDSLERKGVSTGQLYLSSRAHLVFPYHRLIDNLQEQAKGKGKIGTTGKGIGPTYADKVNRVGIRAEELLDPKRVIDEKIVPILTTLKNNRDIKEALPDGLKHSYYTDLVYRVAHQLGPRIVDTVPLIGDHLKKQSDILIEGAHGVLLDPDYGTYPFVTSSQCTIAGQLQGAGIPPIHLTEAHGVYKAYQTRVGGGPMVTEEDTEWSQAVREKGHEYGTTTGRPRRVGPFDGVAAQHAAMVNGFNRISITRLDILSGLGDLRLCKAYQYPNHTQSSSFPSSARELAVCKPVYETMKGWDEDLAEIRRFEDLPEAAQSYIEAIRHYADYATISYVGVGPRRDQVIKMPKRGY